MLKFSPWKGVIRFGKRGKLIPRYIGPFKVLAKVGTVAHRLELLQQLNRVHSTFHVSNLKKCLSNEPLAVPLDEIHNDDKLYFIEEPVEIMDRDPIEVKVNDWEFKGLFSVLLVDNVEEQRWRKNVSSKKKNVSSKRENVFVEEKRMLSSKRKNVLSKRKNVFIKEKECFVKEKNVSSKRKNVFVEEKRRAF
nr:putative reverse transcriptase domain-containing protein [Tanacetum cinerariifolium]